MVAETEQKRKSTDWARKTHFLCRGMEIWNCICNHCFNFLFSLKLKKNGFKCKPKGAFISTNFIYFIISEVTDVRVKK